MLSKQNDLVTAIVEKMKLRNDAALARRLKVAPPVISKIRNGKLPVGASFLIRAHEESGMEIREMKAIAGQPCLDKWSGSRKVSV
jgi:transcriptional regulator with XRE-family HTH domain